MKTSAWQRRYERMKQDPEKYIRYLSEKRNYHRDKRAAEESKLKLPKPRKPKGRWKDRATPEQRRAYNRLLDLRALARSHAVTKRLDLYTVYKLWKCLLPRDKPGIKPRNNLATKTCQTIPSPGANP